MAKIPKGHQRKTFVADPECQQRLTELSKKLGRREADTIRTMIRYGHDYFVNGARLPEAKQGIVP